MNERPNDLENNEKNEQQNKKLCENARMHTIKRRPNNKDQTLLKITPAKSSHENRYFAFSTNKNHCMQSQLVFYGKQQQ